MAKKKLSKKKQEERKIKKISTVIIICLLLFFYLILKTRQYNFIHGLSLPLWYVALGLSTIAAASAVWLFHKKLPDNAPKDRKADIGVVLFALVFVFVITQTLLTHMNHIFDPHEPERYVVVIEDEDYDRGGRKSPGWYEFRVTINGETENITVSRLHVLQFQEGDLYVVEYHKGAFNEPYYIGVGAP